MRKNKETQEILKAAIESGIGLPGSTSFNILSCSTVYVQWDSNKFYVRSTSSPKCDVALEIVLEVQSITSTGRNVNSYDFMLLSSDSNAVFGSDQKDWWILFSGMKCKFLPFSLSKEKLLSYLFPKENDFLAQIAQNALFFNFLKLQDSKNEEIQEMIKAASSSARRRLELLKQTEHTNREKPTPKPFGEQGFHTVVARDIIHNIMVDVRTDFKSRGVKAGYDKVLSATWNYVNTMIKERVQFFTEDQLFVLKNCLEILASKTEARRLVVFKKD